jgi:hypothetical protein
MTTAAVVFPWRWQNERQRRFALHGGFFIAALLVRLACFTGLMVSDDLGYAYFARLVAQGSYALHDAHFATRVGVTVPTGLIYAVFGRSEFTTILLPLLASAACVPLLVVVGTRVIGAPAGAIAGLLALFFPVDVYYATTLVPEPVMSFWILLGVLAWLHARGAASFGWSVASGLLFGAGYLTKEVALFVAAAFVLDLLIHRQWRLAIGVCAGLAFVGGMELASYAAWTGDPLYRVHVISRSQLLYFKDTPDMATTWRLFKEYPYLMLVPNTDMGLHSLVCLVVLVPGALLVDRRALTWVVLWALVPLLYLNFGSASFATYLPVATGPRYIALIYAPVFLLAAATFARMLRAAPVIRLAGFGALTGMTVIAFACAFGDRATGYHTDEAATLRAIAAYERGTNQRVVRFDGPRASEWTNALDLLDASVRRRNLSPKACLAITPDAIMLPHVAGPVACPVPASRGTLPYPFE